MAIVRAQWRKKRGAACGAVLLVMLLMIMAGSAYYVLSAQSARRLAYPRDAVTNAALAEARQGLLSYALLKNDDRPGALPCPDTHAVGSTRYGVAALLAGNHCPGYTGRLPWETLRLDSVPRDGSGAVLWYALSKAFRDDNSANPINSDMPKISSATPLLTVEIRADSDASAPGNDCALLVDTLADVAAVIIAPGAPIAALGQEVHRPAEAVQGFLEGENADGDDTFMLCQHSGYDLNQANLVTNDQVLPIRREEWLRLAEQRALGEARLALQAYYQDANMGGHYPWLAAVTDARVLAQPNTCFGRIAHQAVGETMATGFSVDWNFSAASYTFHDAELHPSATVNAVTQADLASGAGLVVPCDASACGACVWQDAASVDCQGQAEQTDALTGVRSVHTFHWQFTNGQVAWHPATATMPGLRDVTLPDGDFPHQNFAAVLLEKYDSAGNLIGKGSASWDATAVPPPHGSVTMRSIRYNPIFPPWYVKNEWHILTFAAMRASRSPNPANPCPALALDWLNADGSTLALAKTGLDVLVLAAGPALAGQDRTTAPGLADFLEKTNVNGAPPFTQGRARGDFNDQIQEFAP